MATRKVVGRRPEVLRKMKFGNCQWKLITPALGAASVGSGLTFEQSWTKSLIAEGQENSGPAANQSGNQTKQGSMEVRPWIMVNDKETIIIYLWTYRVHINCTQSPSPFSSFWSWEEDWYGQFFPPKPDSIEVDSMPQPRTLLCDGLGLCPAPLTLSPSLPLPSAALIHSILAAASCVTETARNFLFDFNSEEIPVTQSPLLTRKKKKSRALL